MVASLPRNIQLKLEHTLAQWRQWHCEPALQYPPKILRTLGSGLSNFSVLVEAGNSYVVRLDGINPTINSLNRQAEWRILLNAFHAGLAPRPRYFNPDLGSLVCDYLPPDALQPLVSADIAALLRSIHQLPARHHRLELAERILGYEKLLLHRGQPLPEELAQHRGQVTKLLAYTRQQQQPTVLCHNDLLRANRIYSGGRLWAIDWEYSAMGSPWFDLAVTATGDSLDPTAKSGLLEAYFQRPANSDDHQQLLIYSSVYRYLELLWYLAVEYPEPDSVAMQLRVAQLGSDLRALAG